jgi:hypothetical protein
MEEEEEEEEEVEEEVGSGRSALADLEAETWMSGQTCRAAGRVEERL